MLIFETFFISIPKTINVTALKELISTDRDFLSDFSRAYGEAHIRIKNNTIFIMCKLLCLC